MTMTDPHTQLVAGPQLQYELEQFYYHEAELLDAWQLRPWSEFLTNDFLYEVPVPVTLEGIDAPTHSTDFFFCEETRQSLEIWFRRIDPDIFDIAYGENPRQRCRHMVTNVRVSSISGDEIAVRANLLFANRHESDPVEILTAERHDVIRRTPDGLRLAKRVVYLDPMVQTLFHFHVIL